jgi:N-acetylglucosamine kinase-like BadF-type ATPase
VTIVLGVDGGGTKTHAAVADGRGEVLGFGMSGPSNWEDAGFEGASAAVKASVREALSLAGTEAATVERSVFGLAGIDFASDEQKMQGVQAALGLGGECHIVNDSFVALRAGTNHPWGIVVVAGTGSVISGRNPAGETFRTFGLGPTFGDEGSATEISQAAVTAVAGQLIGRAPKTTLLGLMSAAAGIEDPMALIEGLARGRVDEASFASIVFEAAEGGDLVARRILEHAGAALGDLAGFVARRLRMDGSEFELVLAGGMFRTQSRIMRSALEATLRRSARFAQPVQLEAPPVAGAVLLAMEFAAVPADRDIHVRLALGSIEALNRRVGGGQR